MRIYNPHIKKLDEHTVSDFFIGYAITSKGFRFYYSSHAPNIIEVRNAKFLEEHEISGSGSQKVEFEEIKDAPMSLSHDLVVIQNIEEQPVSNLHLSYHNKNNQQ